MTIKTSDIKNAIVLLEKINQYAHEQHVQTEMNYHKDFYEKLIHDSFELYIGLHKELEYRAL